jgi:hypothetical protein
MRKDKYFHEDDVQETFIRFPTSLVTNPKYKEMTNLTKMIWPFLLDLQNTAAKRVDSDGRVFMYELELYLKRLLNLTQDRYAVAILVELEKYDLLDIDILQDDFLKKYYLLKPQSVKDYEDIKDGYRKDVKKAFKKVNDKLYANKSTAAALDFMNNQEVIDTRLLTDDTKLILYKNFRHVEFLVEQNLFSIDLLLVVKRNQVPNLYEFNELLEIAFDLYDFNPDDGNLINFNDFFLLTVEKKSVLNNKKLIMDEVDAKLFSLPNELKKFVYETLLKQSEHYPDRFKLVLGELRAINTVYEDSGRESIPSTVFEKAFRRLFMSEKEIRTVAGYFSKAIMFVKKEEEKQRQFFDEAKKENKEKQPLKKPSEDDSNDSDWVKKIVDWQDIEDDVNKMSPEEKEKYFRDTEELEQKLQNMRQN